jgi:ferrochelatase
MRYWHPLTGETVEEVKRAGYRRVVLLPLYPQFSRTTTGSSRNEWVREARRLGLDGGVQTIVIDEYCEHPLYLEAIARNIRIALTRVPEPDRGKIHLVFSAHGTPLKLVRQGDPYQGQIIRTYQGVLRRGNFGLPHTLCYQSRVGPQRWLEPSLTDTIDRLADGGVTHVLVIPIAFVSDHSETLYEINMEVRRRALDRGMRYYDMMPALHTNPLFISALAGLVLERVTQ